MKAKKLLALMLTLCLAFSCIAVIPFTATVAAADGVTATANTTAIHVGKSTKYNKVPSAIYLNLVKESYSDHTLATLTANVKMLNGTMPKVTMFRAESGTKTLNPKYDLTWNSGDKWVHDTSYNPATGEFVAHIEFQDIPGNSNCWYYDHFTTEGGRTSYKRVNAWDSVKGLWGGIAIGNTNFKDNSYNKDGDGGTSPDDFSEDFIISDIHLEITRVNSSDYSNEWVGKDLAPAVSTFKEGQVYSLAGPNANGGNTDAHNNPFELGRNCWGALTSDLDTVQKVTVDDDFATENRTYVQHPETANTYEYYTCADFGEDVKFEKLGLYGCYSKVADVNKKSFVLKSHGDNAYSNIFIPMNVHKWFSAYDATQYGCHDSSLRENNGNFFLDLTFKAKRLNGNGVPVVGKMYAFKYSAWTTSDESKTKVIEANNSSTQYVEAHDSRIGAPNPSTGRAYNPLAGDTGETQDGVTAATYDASTGLFSARIRIERGNLDQMSRTGISTYLTIGTTEHDYEKNDINAQSTESSFVISDINFTVYDSKDNALAGKPMFGGANIKMPKSVLISAQRILSERLPTLSFIRPAPILL